MCTTLAHYSCLNYIKTSEFPSWYMKAIHPTEETLLTVFLRHEISFGKYLFFFLMSRNCGRSSGTKNETMSSCCKEGSVGGVWVGTLSPS